MRMEEDGWDEYDFPVTHNDDIILKQFLIAKCCHPLFKNNPYLEEGEQK